MLKAYLMVGVLLVGAVVSGFMMMNNPSVLDGKLDEVLSEPDVEAESWHTIAVWTPLTPLGEATPSGGSGFISIFLLDAAQDAFVVLQDNTTDWSASANVHAYADADAFSEDCPSEDPFHIVVRCRFTKDVCYDGSDSQFVANRTKCTITFSGDESGTITHYGNLTDGATGGGMPSNNSSTHPSLWVNFWFEDAVDGYRITDDGSLSIDSIVIAAKY